MLTTSKAGKRLFLSAHLDDVVLSCGGMVSTLSERQEEVTIATIFAGVPDPKQLSDLARSFHDECGLGDDAIRRRRLEDLNAVQRIGVDAIHLDILECLYRCEPSGKPRYRDEAAIFRSHPTEEHDVVDLIVSDLMTTVDLPRWDVIYVPLGIGRHIDHLLLRYAVELLDTSMTSKSSLQLIYYEDLPYACWGRDPDWQATLINGLCPHVYPMDAMTWLTKRDAILQYSSQVPMLWPDQTQLEVDLLDYGCQVGGAQPAERFWARTDPLSIH